MKKLIIGLLFVLFGFSTLSADMSANEIIKKVDENMRGENVYMQMSMSITSLGHKRTMKMQTWCREVKKAL